mmetsp:Transcript_64940/g.203469  ORF Transcript_64940/g.203469 Transcript_64940/m.203469 type:complete len:228 (+) Transcript_64940:728-1411(+)
MWRGPARHQGLGRGAPLRADVPRAQLGRALHPHDARSSDGLQRPLHGPRQPPRLLRRLGRPLQLRRARGLAGRARRHREAGRGEARRGPEAAPGHVRRLGAPGGDDGLVHGQPEGRVPPGLGHDGDQPPLQPGQVCGQAQGPCQVPGRAPQEHLQGRPPSAGRRRAHRRPGQPGEEYAARRARRAFGAGPASHPGVLSAPRARQIPQGLADHRGRREDRRGGGHRHQ